MFFSTPRLCAFYAEWFTLAFGERTGPTSSSWQVLHMQTALNVTGRQKVEADFESAKSAILFTSGVRPKGSEGPYKDVAFAFQVRWVGASWHVYHRHVETLSGLLDVCALLHLTGHQRTRHNMRKAASFHKWE